MKIAIALSGGVDSAFCAWLLSKKGFQVLGITFKMSYLEENVKRASYICEHLGIPHYILDIEKTFENLIIDYFVNSYLKGYTPNPCALCNRLIKFGVLYEYAISLGCDLFATGHYTRLIKKEDRSFLGKSKNIFKSQEYFLALVPQTVLNNVIFPLGDYSKEEVKEYVKKEGIYPFDIKESKEACFIRGGDYRKFIEKRISNYYDYFGLIKHRSGKVLGRHRGFYSFTYGQREGLGISWSSPLYVVDILPDTKEVIVAEREFVRKDKFIVKDVNWFYSPSRYDNLKVKVRYNCYPLSCRIEILDERKILCILKDTKEIPPPGQLAVFYDNDIVVAGGWIDKV